MNIVSLFKIVPVYILIKTENTYLNVHSKISAYGKNITESIRKKIGDAFKITVGKDNSVIEKLTTRLDVKVIENLEEKRISRIK